MLKNSPNIGTGTITVKEDPRILPFGKFLRKTKLNETPQLMNVFLGDMSLIGPRPLTEEGFGAYPNHVQKLIKKVRPGLSGIGSIIFRSEEDIIQGENASVEFYNKEIAPYKGAVEEWFILNKSLYVYFVSIFLTVWVCFRPKSKVLWLIFKGCPKPPKTLEKLF